MNVKTSTDKIHFKRVNGFLVPIESECDDDCGSGVIVWGFLLAVATVFFVLFMMCLGGPS